MPTQTLFLLDDLEDIGRTSELAVSDLKALRAVADWTLRNYAACRGVRGATNAKLASLRTELRQDPDRRS